MKTQINTLRTANQNVYRTLANQQALDAHQGGTPSVERGLIAASVHAENPNELNIELFDMTLTLKANSSFSGKTIWYEGSFPTEMYEAISNRKMPNVYESMCTLMVHNDMTVVAYCLSRKNSQCQWKESSRRGIDESFITIL